MRVAAAIAVVSLVGVFPTESAAVDCGLVRNTIATFSATRDEADNAHVHADAAEWAVHRAMLADVDLDVQMHYARAFGNLERARVILARAHLDLRDANLAFSSSAGIGLFSVGPARAYSSHPLAPASAVASAALHYLARGVSDIDNAMAAIKAIQSNPNLDVDQLRHLNVTVMTADIYLASAPPMLHAAITNLEALLENGRCDG